MNQCNDQRTNCLLPQLEIDERTFDSHEYLMNSYLVLSSWQPGKHKGTWFPMAFVLSCAMA